MVRCNHKTRSGRRCKRLAQPGQMGECWQHWAKGLRVDRALTNITLGYSNWGKSLKVDRALLGYLSPWELGS